MTSSFYRRELKPPSVAFCSPQGRDIFRNALANGTMECYFPLAEQFRTQDEPSFCGLGALTNVLNSLHIDPKHVWKGVWRHFTENMLVCCKSLDEVKGSGINLEEFTCLGKCNGAKVIKKRPDDDVNTLEAFRKDVIEFCQKSEGGFIVVSYSRKILNQTGDGHFSPIAGYCAETDRLLILDVARFKYPPHWCPVEVMYEALKPIDKDTGKSRGWCLLTSADSALVFSWKDDNIFDLNQTLQNAMSMANEYLTSDEMLEHILKSVYKRMLKSLWTQSHLFQIQYSKEHEAVIASVLEQVRATALFPFVDNWAERTEEFQDFTKKNKLCPERLTVALFTLGLGDLVSALIDDETAKNELIQIFHFSVDMEYLNKEILMLQTQYQAVTNYRALDLNHCHDNCEREKLLKHE